MDHNRRTLRTYENNIARYVNNTEDINDPALKPNWEWIDQSLTLLPERGARILEIGSATGRDAAYIERQGFSVTRTDAAIGFVDLLHREGHNAHLLNVLTDPIPGPQDLILANAVFPHFDPEQLQDVLQKCYGALATRGLVAFSSKLGDGERIVTEKLGGDRYMYYWDADKLEDLTRSVGFTILWELTDVPGQYDHRWHFIIASKGIEE